jgi:hypothetical protein
MADAPNLPSFSRGIVTSEAPVSPLSGAEIEQPYEMFARALDRRGEALGKTGEALGDIAVPLAEQAAAERLQKQKITRNADGTINVENPDTAPLIFGAAGHAYNRAIAAGTIAQWHNEISQRFAEMHQQHPVDSAAFKEASQNYLDSISGNIPPIIREGIVREGAQLQTQHFNAITDRAASIDLESQKAAILSQNADLKDTAIALAQKNSPPN